METYSIIWAKAAEEDLISIIRYIHCRNPNAAKKAFFNIKARVSELDKLPERGRIVTELQQQGILQYREIIVAPWRILYRISNSRVYILSVIDSRQNVEDILLERLVRG